MTFLALEQLRTAQGDEFVFSYLENFIKILNSTDIRSAQRKSLMQVLSRHLSSDNVLIMFALVRCFDKYFLKCVGIVLTVANSCILHLGTEALFKSLAICRTIYFQSQNQHNCKKETGNGPCVNLIITINSLKEKAFVRLKCLITNVL